MLLDSLEDADRYKNLAKGFDRALEFLRRPDLKGLPSGRHEIVADQ